MFDFSILRLLRKQLNLTIEQISEKSGISHAFISKLERNIGNPELTTLSKLASALGISSAELVKMAELKSGTVKQAHAESTNGFNFLKISYNNVKILYGNAAVGSKLTRPETHENDYEIIFILKGSLRLSLPGEEHCVKPGESLQFDAVLKHSYEALEDVDFIVVHQRKDGRF